MKSSAEEVLEVPPAVTTVTSTMPAKLPGEVAVQTVVEQLGEVPAIP